MNKGTPGGATCTQPCRGLREERLLETPGAQCVSWAPSSPSSGISDPEFQCTMSLGPLLFHEPGVQDLSEGQVGYCFVYCLESEGENLELSNSVAQHTLTQPEVWPQVFWSRKKGKPGLCCPWGTWGQKSDLKWLSIQMTSPLQKPAPHFGKGLPPPCPAGNTKYGLGEDLPCGLGGAWSHRENKGFPPILFNTPLPFHRQRHTPKSLGPHTTGHFPYIHP